MSKDAKIWTLIGVVVVAVMVGIFILGNRTAKPASSSQSLVHDTSHKLGTGKVTVVEFGDYQCPACGAAYPITKQILNTYGTQLTFVFRNYPLPMHPNAPMAAEAAEAAAAQGKFWEMHDKLYETQNSWASLSNPLDTFVGYAKALGLNTDTFKQAVQNNQYSSVISADQADGNAVGITGTPTFYINGTAAASYDYNTLKGMIDQALKG